MQILKISRSYTKSSQVVGLLTLINKIANMSTVTDIAHGNIDPIIEDLTTAFLKRIKN